MDKVYLKDVVYPVLKMATQYYYRILIKRGDVYHMPNAMSPEYASCEDTNWDLSLYRWSVETMSKIVDILKIDEPLIEKWQETIDHLVEYPQSDKEGYLIGEKTRLSSMHRHWSHLLMIYPLRLQDYKSRPDLADVMTKSINHFLGFKPTDNAYSIAIASIFKQMMGEKDEEAWNHFLSAFDLFRIGKSTMYWEASDSPVNESPFAVAFVLQYMVLRSENGLVEVFPGKMNALSNVTFHQLKAEGGFLVSGVKQNGQTKYLSS